MSRRRRSRLSSSAESDTRRESSEEKCVGPPPLPPSCRPARSIRSLVLRRCATASRGALACTALRCGVRSDAVRARRPTVVALVAAGAIVANAMFLQVAPHPAPMLRGKPRPVATAEATGSVAPVASPARPIDHRRGESRSSPRSRRTREQIVADIQRELSRRGFYRWRDRWRLRPEDRCGNPRFRADRRPERQMREPDEALLKLITRSTVRAPAAPAAARAATGATRCRRHAAAATAGAIAALSARQTGARGAAGARRLRLWPAHAERHPRPRDEGARSSGSSASASCRSPARSASG